MKLFFLILFTVVNLASYSQNVGLGTSTPAAPLHLKSATSFEMLRVEGNTPYISFFDNSQGYRGYLWYTGASMELGTPAASGIPVTISPSLNPVAFFTSSGRMGLGVANPTEKLDVNGNINLSGTLKVDGNTGTAGQVLVSNGIASPSWQNASFANNIRFGVHYDASTTTGALPIHSTFYNLNPSAILIGSDFITISQSGLYHFGGHFYSTVTGSPTFIPELTSWLEFSGTSTINFSLCTWKPMVARTSVSIVWIQQDNFSFDMYIAAPTTVRFFHNIVVSGTITASNPASLYGYLISQ